MDDLHTSCTSTFNIAHEVVEEHHFSRVADSQFLQGVLKNAWLWLAHSYESRVDIHIKEFFRNNGHKMIMEFTHAIG